MDWIKQFIRSHQQALVLLVGYVLVGILAFGLGRFTSPKTLKPQPQVQQTTSVPNNYNPNESAVQSANIITNATAASSSINCTGKIKGSSSLIFHVPGGSFYNRTTHPIRCFDTEAQAQAAGFRKSSR